MTALIMNFKERAFQKELKFIINSSKRILDMLHILNILNNQVKQEEKLMFLNPLDYLIILKQQLQQKSYF